MSGQIHPPRCPQYSLNRRPRQPEIRRVIDGRYDRICAPTDLCCRIGEAEDGRSTGRRGSSRRRGSRVERSGTARRSPAVLRTAVSRQTASLRAQTLRPERSGARFNAFSKPRKPGLAWTMPVPQPRREDAPKLAPNAVDEPVGRDGVCETAGAVDGCASRAGEDDALFDGRGEEDATLLPVGDALVDPEAAARAPAPASNAAPACFAHRPAGSSSVAARTPHCDARPPDGRPFWRRRRLGPSCDAVPASRARAWIAFSRFDLPPQSDNLAR